MNWSYNQQHFTKHPSWDPLGWYWKWRSLTFILKNSFWPIWLRFLGNSAPNMHLGIPKAGIENGGYWSWPSKSFGHFHSKFQKTALNVTHVYWSRPAKECYTSIRVLVIRGFMQWFNHVANMFIDNHNSDLYKTLIYYNLTQERCRTPKDPSGLPR